MKRYKDLLERVEHLETLMRLEYIPGRFDACAACQNGVPCVSGGGALHYACIKDIKEKCKDFTLSKQYKEQK